MSSADFLATSKIHLNFLVTEKSFALMISKPNLLRFESKTLFIQIAYDSNLSYELSTLIGERCAPAREYSLNEILVLLQNPAAPSFWLIQITTAEAMEEWIRKIANELRWVIEFLDKESIDFFSRLADQQKLNGQRYTFEIEIRQSREMSKRAWQNKDYKSFVEILLPFRHALSPSEIKKIEFAEGKMRNDHK